MFSSGDSTKEGPASKLPQVVGRMHFLEAHESLFLQSQQKNESVFFLYLLTSRKAKGPILKGSSDWVRPMQNNLPFD